MNARLTTDGWDGVLATEHRQVRLSEVRSVWYRHPSHFVLPEGMSEPELRHAAAEARCGLAGVLSSLNVLESGRLQMAYTRRIEPAELHDLAGVETTAHLFQRFETKLWECRVTVVGDRVFAAAIHAGSDAGRVDWRADYDRLTYTLVEPPEPVTAGMLAFMKVFGLSFGAFDFAVTPDKEWIMFECNPFGAYGWLEDALDLPITAALADLLANGTTSC